MDVNDVARVYATAQERYCDGSDDDIELDDIEKYMADEPLASRFSEGDEGVWIQAWLWVPNEEPNEEIG